MCFLTAGNICAQTNLSLTANDNRNVNVDGTKVEFHDDGTDDGKGDETQRYIVNSYVGGAKWATPFTPGETHKFTVTLNNSYSPGDNVVGKLYIAALDCEIIDDTYKSYSGNIVAEACIDPLSNNTNNVLTLEVNQSYAAVYLYKKNRGTDYEKVNIASVTRTVSEATPVVISEFADNTITAQTGVTVKLTRSLVKGTWNTICLPFAPTPTQANDIFGKDAKFAQFSSVRNGVMQFTSVDVTNLKAGTPYLVLPTENLSTDNPVVLTGVTIPTTAINPKTVENDNYKFIGTYTKTSFTKDDQKIRFVAKDNQLKYPNTTNPLKALRAYISLPDAQTPNPAKDYFDVDSFVPTSIANIQIEGDGDGAIYNIGGQRVEGKSLPKGIYIREGKKFVVK